MPTDQHPETKREKWEKVDPCNQYGIHKPAFDDYPKVLLTPDYDRMLKATMDNYKKNLLFGSDFVQLIDDRPRPKPYYPRWVRKLAWRFEEAWAGWNDPYRDRYDW